MEDQLLFRFLNGQCTSNELEKIELWMSLDKANAQWLFEIERMWALRKEFRFSESKELSKAFEELKKELEKRKSAAKDSTHFDSREKAAKKRISSPRTKLISWGRNVAAAVIIILFSVNIWQMISPNSGDLNVIEVERGNRASVILSDGTKVWLNSESKLSYPQIFGSGDRLVLLEGEGFFDVTRDVKHPFVVHSDKLEVKVLGTKFNFKAYPNEIDKVFLKEGKVEVAARNQPDKRVILYPDDIISYSYLTGFSSVESTNTETLKKWIVGEHVFIDETLDDIVRNLERTYEVKIVIRDPALKTEKYNCRAPAGVPLSQILELLKKTGELDYEKENNQVILFKRK